MIQKQVEFHLSAKLEEEHGISSLHAVLFTRVMPPKRRMVEHDLSLLKSTLLLLLLEEPK